MAETIPAWQTGEIIQLNYEEAFVYIKKISLSYRVRIKFQYTNKPLWKRMMILLL
ncbi:MAG: hypothetical protein ABIQ88_16870 [Chitinophagaceae bacterium]